MKDLFSLFLILCISPLFSNQGFSQPDVSKGVNLIETQTYTQQENLELLKLYETLRVADVSDGMAYGCRSN